jgi:predicted CoA-substrate-specific enzyme activase
MMAKNERVGIDIGALSLAAVRLDGSMNLMSSFYRPHRGNPGKVIEEALKAIQVTEQDVIGITGSSAGLFAETLGAVRLDITRCQIAAALSSVPMARNIIDIGGASATLIQLDAQGNFQGYSTNSLCAAGTGSFLDEQAYRLGISYKETESLPHVGSPPTIATRCAVFAKSDLIHRQQEGYSKADMWSGLCRGMARTLVNTLFNGRPLDAPAAIIGGVAQNQEVIRWLEKDFKALIYVPENPHLMAAIGAARLCAAVNEKISCLSASVQAHKDSFQVDYHPWLLSIEKSTVPTIQADESYTDDDRNEVRILHWPISGEARGILGIDIGSTSTKLVLMDEEDRVMADIYRKTAGDPVGATKLLFKALSLISARKKTRLEILGVGTTGSGRKLIGKIIGADRIINEISAHVAGAIRTDPSIDTIFEIGGQDSKFMSVQKGHIRDTNMNYVCAAGTGSFVEEQANKLGYEVSRVGEAVLNLRPPRTADRCTVFMEQDVDRLLQQGLSAEEALAGVMVSVVKNYMNKVVGNRHHSRTRIFFQGATARNLGLVAAFEKLLGVQMVVSPYCHVMGAYGVALLVRQSMKEMGQSRSAFRGLDLQKREITLTTDTCNLCQNHCVITHAEIEGGKESPSWGYLCGRDPEEQRVRQNPYERAIRLRQQLWREAGSGPPLPESAGVVGIPQALTTYSYFPLWRRFFHHLGYRVQLSGNTTDVIRDLGTRITGAEFCFPAKAALGHAAFLANEEGVDFVFLPHMISELKNRHSTASKFCPYVQAYPAAANTALSLNGSDTSRLLSPTIDLRLSEGRVLDALQKALGRPLKRTRKQLRRAWREGLQIQRSFELRCIKEGRHILEEARGKGEKVLLLVGRPYNIYDSGLNLGLPKKLAEQGRTVLPLDMLDAPLGALDPLHRNCYWNYGQKILAAFQRVAGDERIDSVYLTNFNCGPDSFLLSFSEHQMADRPFLILELDEHGADAGYMTRIEAYFDVLKRSNAGSLPKPTRREPRRMKDRIIWIPPMHPLGAPFFSAAFRRHGYDARPLPPEDRGAFEQGRACTRGAECLPTALTIGALMQAVQNHRGNERHAFFMPTAEGPCRFGQYCTLHRLILDREGLSDVAILSPSSFNSYQGLEESLRRNMWHALLAADILFKAALKIRPYEIHPGETNRVLAKQQARMEQALQAGENIPAVLNGSVERIMAIPRNKTQKPLVGVVGEIYVRCNTFANEDVIGAIERFGGEAWLSPMGEWILYTAAVQGISFRDRSRNWFKKWMADLKNYYLFRQEQRFYEQAGAALADRHEPDIHSVIEEGKKYLPLNFEGEAILTVGRAAWFAKQGASLVINCAPFGCMPGTITTALFRKISPEIGIPVVNMFYDGRGNQNQRLEVFLNNAIYDNRKTSIEDIQDRTASNRFAIT